MATAHLSDTTLGLIVLFFFFFVNVGGGLCFSRVIHGTLGLLREVE